VFSSITSPWRGAARAARAKVPLRGQTLRRPQAVVARVHHSKVQSTGQEPWSTKLARIRLSPGVQDGTKVSLEFPRTRRQGPRRTSRPQCCARYSLSPDRVRPARDPAIFRTGGAGRAAHNASAVAPNSTTTDHSTSALIGCPIIAPAARQPSTVGDRVMRCVMDGSTRNTSPVMWRGVDPSVSSTFRTRRRRARCRSRTRRAGIVSRGASR
jgi:hypothetical protein